MFKKVFLASLFLLSAGILFGQTVEELKLTDTEIPAGYKKTDELLCETVHAKSFYDQTDLYESLIGKIKSKTYQSFTKKGDSGSILYFEFEDDFKAQSFLDGLLWGESSKPTKSEPDGYYAKGKFLVIWSFPLKSEIRQVSKDKVTKLLHS